ncbi:hypothetical protein VTP01DRAFT_5038 [Rhizomucor pusillus]|uniref:uncharacterized protein n=1 Tax=Rhizomucor pusillus TaxID=4840 RepID=UPI0037447DF3
MQSLLRNSAVADIVVICIDCFWDNRVNIYSPAFGFYEAISTLNEQLHPWQHCPVPSRYKRLTMTAAIKTSMWGPHSIDLIAMRFNNQPASDSNRRNVNQSSRWTKPKRSPSHLEAIRHMVPDTSITESDDTNPHTSTCSPPRSRPTNKHSREEPRLEPHSMENKLRRLILHGVDLDAYENILHLDRQKARQEYRRIQKRYLDWCRERSLEALQPARTNQPHQLSGP